MKRFGVQLPAAYQILPESIDFVISGFSRWSPPGSQTLSLTKRDCGEWYNQFIDRLIGAMGKEYLPVCRMSDGEFLFALGQQPADIRAPLILRVTGALLSSVKKHFCCHGNGFEAESLGHYQSGTYTRSEWDAAQKLYPELIKHISEKGILAPHLSYGKKPFQEHYFPAFRKWLDMHTVVLTDSNYIPFYFVYAALTGPRKQEIFAGRRVLVVNSAKGEKRSAIERGLLREGVKIVSWCDISACRSMYDVIDISRFKEQVDFALVGAGVGKPKILVQMESLQVPCIDAGYVFEVWANSANAAYRPFCSPDSTKP